GPDSADAAGRGEYLRTGDLAQADPRRGLLAHRAPHDPGARRLQLSAPEPRVGIWFSLSRPGVSRASGFSPLLRAPPVGHADPPGSALARQVPGPGPRRLAEIGRASCRERE